MYSPVPPLLGAGLFLASFSVQSQPCPLPPIRQLSQISATCSAITLTMLHDQLDRPYLYVANKEAGLTIYDIRDPKKPKLTAKVPVRSFASLQVMNLCQQDQYLYLALGNHFNQKQESGMAIVEISDPEKPQVLSWWSLPESSGGSGIVKVQGDYAYLGAMGNGLIILDISDKHAIRFVSQFVPDIRFPDPKAKKSLFNARGMEVAGDRLYLCYDAGGLRIIDIRDKKNPAETGRYSNPVMNGRPRAYNNLVLDDSLVYIAADYCGMEVLNIKDPLNIRLTGWWNPYGCPLNNWFNSPVHANEIALDKKNNLLFISTGKSDLSVISVADPSRPRLCGGFGGVYNGMGTWGVSRYGTNLYLSYTCAMIPFPSNWTGIRLLSYAE